MRVVEVTVRREIIRSHAKDMSRLAGEVTNRKLPAKTVHSKGDTADAINSFIDELNVMSAQLGAYMEKIAARTMDIDKSFGSMDELIAGFFKK